MATWADVLGYMSLLNNELETGSGEDDEAMALRACRASQHQLEIIAASLPRCLGSTITTSSTSALGETTTWPSALLRLDALWMLDSTNVPIRKVERIQEVGGHVPTLPWPINLISPGSGLPYGYFTDMANFYWLPKPDAVYSIRIYGLVQQTEPTARGDTFAYPTRCQLAVATFAVKLMRFGVDDAKQDIAALGEEIFRPLLRGLRKYDRSSALDKSYENYHST